MQIRRDLYFRMAAFVLFVSTINIVKWYGFILLISSNCKGHNCVCVCAKCTHSNVQIMVWVVFNQSILYCAKHALFSGLPAFVFALKLDVTFNTHTHTQKPNKAKRRENKKKERKMHN